MIPWNNLFDLKGDAASIEVINQRIISDASIEGTNLIVLVMAIMIACIGLNLNSVAVIIGAMLISPLMGGHRSNWVWHGNIRRSFYTQIII